MSSTQRNRAVLRRSRHAAALTIFAALAGLGLLGTTTEMAQVCNRTTTANTAVVSCRPMQPSDPTMLYGTVLAALLLGPEARHLRSAFSLTATPASGATPATPTQKKHSK